MWYQRLILRHTVCPFGLTPDALMIRGTTLKPRLPLFARLRPPGQVLGRCVDGVQENCSQEEKKKGGETASEKDTHEHTAPDSREACATRGEREDGG
jgi:hypothetical protein